MGQGSPRLVTPDVSRQRMVTGETKCMSSANGVSSNRCSDNRCQPAAACLRTSDRSLCERIRTAWPGRGTAPHYGDPANPRVAANTVVRFGGCHCVT